MRRIFLAAITGWSLSISACVPYQHQRRYVEAAPVERPILGGRDSLARAYNLGLVDGNAVRRAPASAFTKVLLIGVLAGTIALAAATKSLIAIIYGGAAEGGVLALSAAQKERQPLPTPADSVQTIYGLRSPEMWDRYLAGYSDAVAIKREVEVKSEYIGAAVSVVAAGLVYVILSLMKGIFKHIS